MTSPPPAASPPPAPILVSVVIPLGEHLDHLDAQLAALAAQRCDLPVEVILSCNGVDPRQLVTSHRLPAFPPRWEARVVDATAVRGPSHARNVGWRASHGDLLLFCDADDLIADGWIAAMVRALASAEVVGGAQEYETLNGRRRGSWGRINVDGLPRKLGHLPHATSSNLGVRRCVLEALGGFDEALERSEDVDFSWRAQYAGCSVAFAPDALVHFRRRETLRALFAQAWADAANDPALLDRHAGHGVRWRLRDYAREAAGVVASVLLLPVGGASRLATRAGRFLGHVIRPGMLTVGR